MNYDTIITGGTIVDGTGGAPYQGDVAIKDGRIAKLGDLGEHSAGKTIDATGQTVTPGFVDLHTHLDAQVGWDPELTSSSYHGVTTALIGNCGVGFAPVAEKNRQYMAKLMESVEDIAAEAILDGLPWNWTDYGGYLDSVQALKPALNIVGLAGHIVGVLGRLCGGGFCLLLGASLVAPGERVLDRARGASPIRGLQPRCGFAAKCCAESVDDVGLLAAGPGRLAALDVCDGDGAEFGLPILDSHPGHPTPRTAGMGPQHAFSPPGSPRAQPGIHRQKPRRGVHCLGPSVRHISSRERTPRLWHHHPC